MALPDFQSLMLPTLEALDDGKEAGTAVIRERVAASEKIPSEELGELLPSGRQTKFSNRIAWALSHMLRAGLVTRIRRGVYLLTTEGEQLLDTDPNRVDLKVLRTYSAYIDWKKDARSGPETPDDEQTTSEPPMETPEEALDRAVGELRESIESEVMDRVLNAKPKFLERVVVDLLIAMGYGAGDAAMGQVTGGSGDGGIDGKIREDALGLDEVYVQAKRHAPGNSVGEHDLRSFAGAIDMAGTNKGVFVTTSKFTRAATEFVKLSPKRIVLIDGRRLARLMVEHNIGVRVRRRLQIKRMDEDYFGQELP